MPPNPILTIKAPIVNEQKQLDRLETIAYEVDLAQQRQSSCPWNILGCLEGLQG